MRRVALIACMLAISGSAFAQSSSRDLSSKGATVGTSPSTVSSEHARTHLELSSQSKTAYIYCTIDGSVPVAAPTANQITLAPLAEKWWTIGVIPSNAINCIADTASTPLTTVE
jgi:hypothetical protein